MKLHETSQAKGEADNLKVGDAIESTPKPAPRKTIFSIFGLDNLSPARKPAQSEASPSQITESTNNSSQNSAAMVKTVPKESINSGGPKTLSIKFASIKSMLG